MSDRKYLGVWIRSKRIEAGLTMEKTSELLGYTSKGIIANLERGAGTLPVEKIIPLSKILKIDLHDFLNQIKIYDPSLYFKYRTLESDILNSFTNRVIGLTEIRAHHKPFPASLPGAEKVPYNFSYVNKGRRIRHFMDIIYYVN